MKCGDAGAEGATGEQRAGPRDRPLGEEAQDCAAGAIEKKRDPYWDNVKAVCVFFVLVSHSLQFGSRLPFRGGPEHIIEYVESPGVLAALSGFLVTLSVVVMPGFTFISGLLSSEDTMAPRRKKQLLQMGATCCINQVAMAAIMTREMPIKLFGAHGVHWFLVCLLFWRLTLPFWMMLRRPVSVSVVISVLVNFTDATNTYFRSFLCFLPFFLAGHLTRRAGGKEALAEFRRPAWRLGFFTVVVLGTALPPLLVPRDGVTSLGVFLTTITGTYECFMYETEVCQTLASLPLRLLYFLFAVPMIPAFLGVIPNRRVWGLTRAGNFSMYIFLLHIWFIVPLVLIAPRIQPGLCIVGAVLVAFAVWGLLGTGCARPCCKWCIEPQVEWFIKPTVAATWQELAEAEAAMTIEAPVEVVVDLAALASPDAEQQV